MNSYFKHVIKNSFIFSTIFLLIVFLIGSPVKAQDYSTLGKGTYNINASLSCYVNAMGGIEFGAPLLEKAQIIVDESGNKKMTLFFTKSQVTIQNITCDTFIDPAPSYVNNDRGVTSGTLGIYLQNGALDTSNISYTLSNDTAENASKQQVQYIKSITFPLEAQSDVYYLTLYINSNVMGVQFSNPSSAATSATYPAKLTVDWSSLSGGSSSSSNSQGSTATGTTDTASDTSPVGKDGLNIYYAGGSEKNNFILAYYNNPFIIGVFIVAGALVIAGIALIALSLNKKTLGGENEENYEKDIENEGGQQEA